MKYTPPYPGTARPTALRLLALVAAVYLALTMGARTVTAEIPGHSRLISGPVAWLLSASKDLRPAHKDRISVAASLQRAVRPGALIGWAQRHHLEVRWQPGADWAYIEGRPAAVGSALNVAIHDYRSRSGQVFYASAQQPSIPTSLRDEVSELGSILGYQLMHRAKPPNIPVDVPRGGLIPPALLRTYNAEPLGRDGMTGKGQTIVFFEIDGYKQADLDRWSDKLGSPRFTPELIGGQPGKVLGETEMDLEVLPMIRFTPRTSAHPSAVNMMIAQLLGNSVNSFTWNKPASQ